MGSCRPFSEADTYLQSLAVAGCIADTSFLIAVTDKDNHFYDDAQFLFEKLVEYQIPIFVTVTARAEFIDFHRRVIITETLMDMLASASKWKISSAVRDVLKSQKGWIDNQARDGSDPYLPDFRIKKCKQVFSPKTQSGQIGWVELCKEYLSGRLIVAWTDIAEALSLNYVDMRADGSKEFFRKDLKWEDMCRVAEESALGSNDAMILNLLDSSIFPFVVTADYDLAYGVLLSTKDKTALIPDGVYRNHVKKLRFGALPN